MPSERDDWGFFCDYLRQWWLEQPVFGDTAQEREQALRRGGYTIVASMDPTTQAAALAQSLTVYGYNSPRAMPIAAVQPGTGRVLASYQLATGAGFVNDVVLTKRTAWFTDSQNPVLYGLPLGKGGRLPAAGAVIRLPLSGDYVHQPGFNLNGIAATPDGKRLLAVQSSTGLLFRIDPRTGVARTVDLGGYLLTNGDGLLVLGRTLYVVQNQLNRVAVFKLHRTGTRGTLQRTITSPDFDVPTTIAAKGRWLYLPNARFSTPTTPQTTYTAVRVSR